MALENNERILSYTEAVKLLSPREVQIMDYIIEGYTISEIANKLYLSEHTINTHKKNITRKLSIYGPNAIIKWREAVRNNFGQ